MSIRYHSVKKKALKLEALANAEEYPVQILAQVLNCHKTALIEHHKV
jgi:hypothetical protein